MEKENIQEPIAKRTEREPLEKLSYAEKGRFFKLRNWLNTIFILLALAGMAIYAFKSTETGTVILITSVAIKGFECILRILK